MPKRASSLLLGLAVALALPAGAWAQRIELEPYLGVYVPVQDVIDETVDVPGLGSADVQGTQKEGVAFGGRLTLWLSGALGLEGNFLYASSDAELEADGASEGEESAGVWVADGRLALKLLPGPIGLHIDGGVALIGRTGDAYEDVEEGKTDVGGVLGAGVRVELPGPLALRGDLDGYIYSAQLTIEEETLGTLEFEDQLQVDLVVSVGLVIGLSGD